MKLKYLFLFLTFALMVFWGAFQQTNAQLDTLVVQWDDPSNPGTPLLNALHDAVIADTNSDGTHVQNRVYKLLQGGVYWNVDHLDNSGYHLRLVGEPGNPNDPQAFPPVLQRHYNEAADFVDDKLISGSGSLTMKNLYVIECDDQGVQTAYQPIELSSSGERFVFDNVIFERTNFAALAFTNTNNDISVTNCVFRNLIGEPSTQQYEGRGMSFWIDQDSIIIENNTFFNINFTPFQLEGGSAEYLRFNHNTFVNVGRNLAIDASEWQEAYFANNLLVNPFWQGEGYADLTDPNREPGQYYTGIWDIDDLPSKYGPEDGRRILFAYNAAWRDPLFADYYADSIRAQPFVSTLGKGFVDQYEQIVVRDTTWLSSRPNMPTYFSQTFIQDSMIQNIKDIRAGVNPAQPYFWRLPELAGSVCNICPSWPLPEDFSYTDNLVGSDGLPLGDLNWFANAKADFEANKDQYISQMEGLAGNEISFVVDSIAEAENGTLGGDASIGLTSGFAFYRFEVAGTILWTFDLPSAVPDCKLVVYTNLTGQNPRGENLLINGVNLTNNTGFGEYHWTSPPLILDGWDSLSVTSDSMQHNDANTLAAMQAAFDLPAGTNTIELRKSWGYQNFSGVSIYDASGNLVKKLTIQEADYDGGILTVEGAVWTASGLQFVKLGSNGNITWNLNASEAGNYILRIFYQNYSGAQTGQISVDGSTVVPIVNFDSNTDSTGLDLLTNEFPLTAGAHSIALSGTSANIDYIQLIQKKIISDVNDPNILNNYYLEQNYPNPFNPTTNINFSIGKASNVKLTIYNILGQKVVTLVNGFMNAGAYTVQFNAVNLASGVYFYSLEAGNFNINKKMILLK